ncbi:dipeptide/oligopeptide/nickel ABC transporter permease/ATP-binding protein [Saccharothrix deserti]|uniref:dipeptide/oligopeptide/nickel ABC transporter permease/ATP-binding protein n=1 Tax=Saccharothrix deserti TaxID=2593674 RepID=UPI00131E5D2C|nr:dipeptide/oligopeptide/nickel ABC transporter permease/ATP-binding protein [Saccharothrix deserti]
MSGAVGLGRFLGGLLRRPLALVSLLWLLAVVFCALFPAVVTSRDPLEQDLLASLQGPSAAHPLGTDRLGQDLLSRLVHGGASTLWGVLVATVVSVVIGVALGLVAGYLGGFVDAITVRIAELLFAIPGVIILLVVFAVFPNNVTAAMVTFGVLLASGLIRVVRSATMSVRQELFVAAARVSGLSDARILYRHVLPRLTSLVIVQAALIAAFALVTQAGLAFLGFGPPPPQPSWGGLVEEARGVVVQAPWALVPPGAAIALTVLAFSLLGDAVRDAATQSWSSTKLVRRTARPRASSPGDTDESPAPEKTLLSVRHLSIAIPLRSATGDRALTTVVDDVSFDISPGEVVGLVGESGCGKSVTALSVLGLTPGGGSITGGSCLFAGTDLVRASARQWGEVRGRGIGFVAQEPMVSLDPTVRAGAQLAEAVRRHTKVSRREARQRAVDLLRSVRLPDPADVARRYPHQMSGGMAQRVAIAFALAGSPSLLIADEPTTALDVTVQAEILALLRTLSRERGMAVLMVTHDWGVVAELCDRAIVMYAGQIVEACTVDSIFAQPRHPYTAGLLRSDPHRVVDGERLPTIAGTVPAPTEWPTGCRFADRCDLAITDCRRAPVQLSDSGPAHVARCLRSDDLLLQTVPT